MLDISIVFRSPERFFLFHGEEEEKKAHKQEKISSNSRGFRSPDINSTPHFPAVRILSFLSLLPHRDVRSVCLCLPSRLHCPLFLCCRKQSNEQQKTVKGREEIRTCTSAPRRGNLKQLQSFRVGKCRERRQCFISQIPVNTQLALEIDSIIYNPVGRGP